MLIQLHVIYLPGKGVRFPGNGIPGCLNIGNIPRSYCSWEVLSHPDVIHIPGSSRYVKCLPFGRFLFKWKGTNFTHKKEDPGIKNDVHFKNSAHKLTTTTKKKGCTSASTWICFSSCPQKSSKARINSSFGQWIKAFPINGWLPFCRLNKRFQLRICEPNSSYQIPMKSKLFEEKSNIQWMEMPRNAPHAVGQPFGSFGC